MGKKAGVGVGSKRRHWWDSALGNCVGDVVAVAHRALWHSGIRSRRAVVTRKPPRPGSPALHRPVPPQSSPLTSRPGHVHAKHLQPPFWLRERLWKLLEPMWPMPVHHSYPATLSVHVGGPSQNTQPMSCASAQDLWPRDFPLRFL